MAATAVNLYSCPGKVIVEAVPATTKGGAKIGGKVTIRDVAREAGVGIGTVSRVLTGSGPVASSTRRRVLEVVERLHFYPSVAARRLATGKTTTLGALVPFFTKHYYLEILRGIEQSASAREYSLAIYNVERREQALGHLEFLAGGRRVDGLVVVALSGDLIHDSFPAGAPFPMVCVDTECPGGCTSISVDHEMGMYLAVRHLLGLGHRAIGLIDRPQDQVSGTITEARQNGYRKACREAGVSVREELMTVSDYSEEGGYKATGALLDAPQPPSAISCASDLQAIGAISAIRERGLNPGTDVAVTGYHDVELARYVGLTTVRLPASVMGEAAVTELLSRLAGLDSYEPDSIPRPELIVRKSCGSS